MLLEKRSLCKEFSLYEKLLLEVKEHNINQNVTFYNIVLLISMYWNVLK